MNKHIPELTTTTTNSLILEQTINNRLTNRVSHSQCATPGHTPQPKTILCLKHSYLRAFSFYYSLVFFAFEL